MTNLTEVSNKARENAREMSTREVLTMAVNIFNIAARDIEANDFEDVTETVVEANAYFFAVSRVHKDDVELYEAVRAVHNQMHVTMHELSQKGLID